MLEFGISKSKILLCVWKESMGNLKICTLCGILELCCFRHAVMAGSFYMK